MFFLEILDTLFTLVVEYIYFAILTAMIVIDHIQALFQVRGERSYKKILEAKTFEELCVLHGFTVELHTVVTRDGYHLGLHRLPAKQWHRLDHEGTSTGKPVVYLQHGFGMSSEVWVCLTEPDRCLPFALVKEGYDVWLGNNRGNKYSMEMESGGIDSVKFWDFSFDNFACNDIPDSIQYILDITQVKKLSYVGFSQGCAQAFAALSTNPQLNEQINLLIGLAPAMCPSPATVLLRGFAKLSSASAFRILGRKSFFSPMIKLQSILHPLIFTAVMDVAILWLFGLRSKNISVHQKIAAYAHLHAFTSVKVIVHWLQVMRNSAFCLYDNDDTNQTGHPSQFNTQNITTPITLFYGDSDSLLDIDAMLLHLPRNTKAKKLETYEHLDILWGKGVHVDVLPDVLDALKEV